MAPSCTGPHIAVSRIAPAVDLTQLSENITTEVLIRAPGILFARSCSYLIGSEEA